MIIVIDVFLLIAIFHVYREYVRVKRMNLEQKILFKYCDLRRDLMKLLRENKNVRVDSLPVLFLYRTLGHFIHYSHKMNYRFMSEEFLYAVLKDEKDMESEKFFRRFMQQSKEQDEQLLKIMKGFILNTLKAFSTHNRFFLLSFLVVVLRVEIVKNIFKKIVAPVMDKIDSIRTMKESYYFLVSLERWDRALPNAA